ncbi:TetR/AcrR family transcriptional regulator [Alteromonas sp. McT4-15]|uniref:TetR/AcrR family transcriptional regulator n=1 Tax=Alteromonas sp. McT4-15 TaxID=2881256 RepID=UPI0012E558AE|nr:TetR/AcrR family transcriptional regulator [Alteromonas sp. McT4-15]MCB4438186.1 TetR/AcrR family transcriptional regulator [Alteromonas sp. McT4-15]GFD90673.1 TetR family transcriptional regulator [Tenacibaculum sp. KUL152]
MDTTKKSKKAHLVETAQKLFYRQGIKGTGIDAVLAESGVAKRTLYNHFKSKDELIIATLKRRDDEFMSMLKRLVAKFEKTEGNEGPYCRILAFFDAITEWTQMSTFSGCMFINASAEYPRQDDPIHAICTMHKKVVIQYIEELIGNLPLKQPKETAIKLALLADGAIVSAHTTNLAEAGEIAKDMALMLLRAQSTERQRG